MYVLILLFSLEPQNRKSGLYYRTDNSIVQTTVHAKTITKDLKRVSGKNTDEWANRLKGILYKFCSLESPTEVEPRTQPANSSRKNGENVS